MADENKDFMPEMIFERRKFVRIDGTYVAAYREAASSDPKSDITQTKNISVGGALITTDRQFKPGAKLIVKLRLPDKPDYIDVKVEVVDSVKKSKGRSLLCNTRVKFIGIRDKDREHINKIVAYNIEKHKKEEGKDAI